MEPIRSYADVVRAAPRQRKQQFDHASSNARFSGFDVSKAQGDLHKRFPLPPLSKIKKVEEPFWFTNEFPDDYFSERLDLKKTIKQMSTLQSKKRGRCVAIVTGEGGLFSSLPEFSKFCDMVIQVDSNPAVLHLSMLLLSALRKANSLEDESVILHNVLKKFESEVPWFDKKESEEVKNQFYKYKCNMKPLHCYSSECRLQEFKKLLDFPTCFLYGNYFSHSDMHDLAKLLQTNDLSIIFLNLSNVAEYFCDFYKLNPFAGKIAGFDVLSHVRLLPVLEDALCAYSSVFGVQFWTSTCTRENFSKELYDTSKRRCDQMMKSLALNEQDHLYNEEMPYSLSSVCLFLSSSKQRDLDIDSLLRLTFSRLDEKSVKELEKDFDEIISRLKTNPFYKNHTQDHEHFIRLMTTALSDYRKV